jgi:dTDP-L-rhamnose 4-epimerase
MNILISGGAGFIGSDLALKLIEHNHKITVLDNLSPQIHGQNHNESELFLKIKDKVNFIHGDVRNSDDWKKALTNQDAIIHLAAETGTGQSMYEIEKYIDVNTKGTAIFLDYIANNRTNVKKVIIASSRSIYGEGKYVDSKGAFHYPTVRLKQSMQNKQFEPEFNGEILKVTATDEDSIIHPISIYGITKQVQEQLVLNVCKSIGIAGVALRFQNVYGPGQSLTNPYTGILSVFSNLILNKKEINIFEDGLESRDFVYIDDVVESIYLSLINDNANDKSYNVGTGIATTVNEVATILQKCYNIDIPTTISGNYRLGDIRHNFADISLIQKDLNWSPKVDINKGLQNFSKWVLSQKLPELKYEKSLEEMKEKGMFK